MGVREGNSLSTKRFAFCKSLFKRLAQHNDILLIQEAKYDNELENKVSRMLPTFVFFHNPHTPNSAGTFIAVRKKYAQHFSIEHRTVHEGYIQTLVFTPKHQGLPFSVTNTYLL